MRFALDRYAIAAAVMKQVTYQQAVRHKASVMEVACIAAAEGKSSLLAVMYDEAVR